MHSRIHILFNQSVHALTHTHLVQPKCAHTHTYTLFNQSAHVLTHTHLNQPKCACIHAYTPYSTKVRMYSHIHILFSMYFHIHILFSMHSHIHILLATVCMHSHTHKWAVTANKHFTALSAVYRCLCDTYMDTNELQIYAKWTLQQKSSLLTACKHTVIKTQSSTHM